MIAPVRADPLITARIVEIVKAVAIVLDTVARLRYIVTMSHTLRVTGQIETLYSDGSGAPAVLACDGYRFALDYPGEIRCRALGNGSHRAASAARREYLRQIEQLASAEWRRLNLEMYPLAVR